MIGGYHAAPAAAWSQLGVGQAVSCVDGLHDVGGAVSFSDVGESLRAHAVGDTQRAAKRVQVGEACSSPCHGSPAIKAIV